jgi:cytochrome c-type biogenesis protein CcmH
VKRVWRWAPWIVLVVLAVTLLAIGSHRTSHPTIDAQVMHIANEVRCPVCDGETAAQSSAAASVQIRTQIRQELLAGQTSDQILAGLVRAYGPGILEKPQTSGVGLIVWVAPVVATVLAGAALVWAFIRWRRRGQPAAGGEDEAALSEPALTPVANMATVSGGERVLMGEPVANGGPVPTGGRVPVGVRDLAPAPSAPSLDDALAAVVAPAAAVATVQSSGSSASRADAPARRSASGVDPSVARGAGDPSGPSTPDATTPEEPDEKDRPIPRRQQWLRAVVIGVGVCFIAAGAGWAVAATSSTRLPGQTISGKELGSEALAQDMQAAQADAAKGNAVAAIKEYQKILQTDPTQVDALTGEGWLLVQTAQPSLLQQGIQLLASAEASDPTYGPAHVYRGVAFMTEADYSDAIPEFQWYLAHQPDPTVAGQVRQELQQAEAGARAASAAGQS